VVIHVLLCAFAVNSVTVPSAQLFGSAFSGHPFTAHPQKEANTIQLAAVFTQLPDSDILH